MNKILCQTILKEELVSLQSSVKIYKGSTNNFKQESKDAVRNYLPARVRMSNNTSLKCELFTLYYIDMQLQKQMA